jgi:hypothetical protein
MAFETDHKPETLPVSFWNERLNILKASKSLDIARMEIGKS